ncbi:hypothetical protein RDI58_009140 [Solanum bulbocastanum]
MFFISF